MIKKTNLFQKSNWNRVFDIHHLILCFGLFTASVAWGQTIRTWTGLDTVSSTDIGRATNWSGHTLPNPTPADIAQWDGTYSGGGALVLTYSTGFAGGSTALGICLSLTSSQTSDVTIDSTSGVGFRVSNLTNNSASAAFTLGNNASSTIFPVTLGKNSLSSHFWYNNSSATATIGNNVAFTMGGGGAHTILFDGPGNWAFYGFQNSTVSGQGLNIIKNGSGTLLMDPDTYGASFGAGKGGTLTINSGTVKVGGTDTFVANLSGGYNNAIVNTNGLLDLNGISSISLNGLSGNGSGTVDTVTGGTVTLTVGMAGDNGGTFNGVIRNSAGSVAVVMQGANTWTLNGANTYSGGTTVNAGTLIINGSVASSVIVNSGAVAFGGSGVVNGNLTLGSGVNGVFNPFTPLTVTGNVTLNNNAVVVNVPASTFLGAGIYTLMTNTIAGNSGAFNSTPTFTFGSGASVVAGTYTVTSTANAVTLTVVASAIPDTWINNSGGNWSTAANWDSNPNVPHSAGDAVQLGVGSGLTTVILDADETIGSLLFTNNNSFRIADAGHTLTLDGNGSGVQVSVTGGISNLIATAISLNDDVAVSVGTNCALSISHTISSGSARTVAINGTGTMGLFANNAYGPTAGTVGTTLSGGSTLQLGNAHAVGAGDLGFSGNATVQALIPMNFANDIQINGAFTGTFDTSNNAVTYTGTIQNLSGTFAKTGSGTMTIPNALNYTGTTKVQGGTLILSSSGTSTVGGLIQSLNTNSLLKITAGTLNVTPTSGGSLVDNGGSMEIDSGATVNLNPSTFVPLGDTAGTVSTLTINGGALFVNISSANSFVIGRFGTGILNLNGGTLQANKFSIAGGEAGPLNAALNLNGGQLQVPDIGAGTGVGKVYFNGGALVATAANSSYWSDHTHLSAYARDGGGTFDNGGFAISLGQPILHSDVMGDNAKDGGMTFQGANVTRWSNTTVISNNYTGDTRILAGTTLEIANNAVLSPVSTVSIANGAVLQLDQTVTNLVGGLVTNGVSLPPGLYSSNNVVPYIIGPGYLLVPPSGPVGSAFLTNSVSGNQLQLSWPAGQGWKLQMLTNDLPSTNWIYVTDGSASSTNIMFNPSFRSVFYRLVYP